MFGQGQSLFVYRRGNQANVCLEKQEEDKIYIICLRCGDSGHDMFSCRSDYSPVNLKVFISFFMLSSITLSLYDIFC